MSQLSYAAAGVSIDAGDELVERIKPAAKRTLIPGVLGSIGGFGALFEVSRDFRNPVLVTGTDGVGTKLMLAFQLGRHDTVGQDLVAMSVNDILVQGAKSLFFLDYYACGKLDVDVAERVVKGVAKGCELAGCALIGGETAEMPGMYPEGEYDLAGFAVGVVEKDEIIDGTTIKPGDVVLGLASSGPHSNGFSLLRKVIPDKVRLPAYIVIIAGFTTIVQMLVKAFVPALDTALGVYLPLIVVNCIILARAESFASKNPPLASMADGLGMGLGFTISLSIISAVRELIGSGTLLGFPVLGSNYPGVLLFILAPGGYITLGLVMVAFNAVMKKIDGRRRAAAEGSVA